MFVVTGVSGNTGSVVANALLSAGRPVRVLARSAEKAKPFVERGAVLATGSLEDPATLEKALAGAEGLYLLSPPDFGATDFVADRTRLLSSVVRAAQAARVKHVVLLSSIGAQHPSGTGVVRTVHAGERALRASGLSATFVRAAYFVENFGAVAPAIQKDGVLPTFISRDFVLPMVSTPDIGRVAAQALLEGPRGVDVIELSGPADVSPKEVADTAARILGKPVHAVDAPLEAVVPTFMSFGASENVATLFRELYEGIKTGRVSWEGQGARRVRGTVTVEETLRSLLA